MSDYLPLIVDLYFGDTTLSASLKKQKKDDASLPFWALKVSFISETFVIQPLPWNERKRYNDICLSNQKFAISVLNFLTAQKDFKNLPILEIGCGDGLLSMFLKRKGFKGVVTSDFENADSMYTLKWNCGENGVYHRHIPFNWGATFPKGELTQYWQQMVSLALPDPHRYSPYIDMPSNVHVFLGTGTSLVLASYRRHVYSGGAVSVSFQFSPVVADCDIDCIVSANDVLSLPEYHPMFDHLLQQLFSFVSQDLEGVPLLLLGLSSEPKEAELKFLVCLDSQGYSVDPLGKEGNAYLIGLKPKDFIT